MSEDSIAAVDEWLAVWLLRGRDEAAANDSGLVVVRRVLTLFAELPDPSEAMRGRIAATLLNAGMFHQRLSAPDSALEYFGRSLSLFRELGDVSGEARAHTWIGSQHWSAGALDSAAVHYRLALGGWRRLDNAEQEASTLEAFAQLQEQLGQPDSAIATYRLAARAWRRAADREKENPFTKQYLAVGAARAATGIGWIQRAAGRVEEAWESFKEALAIARENVERDEEIGALWGIGRMHSDAGRPDSAIASLNAVLDLYGEAMSPEARAGKALTLDAVGSVYANLGQIDSASAYLARSLELRRQSGDRSGEMSTLMHFGMMEEDPDSAAAYYAEALRLARELADTVGIASALNNLGNLLLAEHPDSALDYLRTSLALKSSTGAEVEVTLLNIGYAHAWLDSPDSALANYRQALKLVRASGVTGTEALTLQAMGSAYRQRDAPGDRQHAVAYYDSATAVMGRIGSHAGSDESRLSLGERQSPAYVDWALAWLSREGETGSRSARLAALGAVERGRAQALLALMREERRRSVPVPEPGGNLEREVRQLVGSGVPRSAALLSYLVSSDTLVSWLVLGPDSVLVERTTIRRDSVVSLVAAVRASLGVDERARGMEDLERSSIVVAPRRATDFASTAAMASVLLLPPALLEALPAGRELIVIPHGPLAMLPFAALPLGDEPLGARYALRYAPSLAALAEAEGRPSLGRDRKQALADEEKVYIAGDPPMPTVRLEDGDSLKLAPLQGAAEEAKWLAGTLVPLPWSNPRDGSESGVKSLGLSDRGVTEQWNRVFGFGGKKLIHLATHGFAYSSESRARDSFIALAPGNEEDGLLTVGEVLDELPTLEADLVVLSACQTGLGNLSEAEGTVGLQRAFLAKGARSVLVSLWNVSDEATGLLMRQFYTHWLEDPDAPSKSEALRRSQEDVRRTAGFEHPRFWAAFQLVGAS